jgi:hypothetical protein
MAEAGNWVIAIVGAAAFWSAFARLLQAVPYAPGAQLPRARLLGRRRGGRSPASVGSAVADRARASRPRRLAATVTNVLASALIAIVFAGAVVVFSAAVLDWIQAAVALLS